MKFAGHIVAIERKSGEETQKEDVLVELTDVKKDGTIELMVRDRNEDFYIQFRLQDLVTEAMSLGREAE